MKILVIGCGSIGQRHIRNLVSINAGEVFAFDIDRKKLKEVKNISSSIIISNNLSRLWEKKPQVALIATPTSLHIKYALEAARRNCHLFIEKPLSHNIGELDELIKIVKQKKLISFIGYNNRFNACLIRIKELLESKSIGRVVWGRFHFGSYLPHRHPWEDYQFGYGAKKSLGGGVILDSVSHHLDALVFLLGRPQEVFSYSSKSHLLDINVEDIAEVLAKFSSGMVISFHANFVQQPYKRTFELIGERGTISCDLVENVLRQYDLSTKRWKIFYGDKDANASYLKEIKYFMKSIEKKVLPPVDILSGKEQLNILLKIKKSSWVKRWIKV